MKSSMIEPLYHLDSSTSDADSKTNTNTNAIDKIYDNEDMYVEAKEGGKLAEREHHESLTGIRSGLYVMEDKKKTEPSLHSFKVKERNHDDNQQRNEASVIQVAPCLENSRIASPVDIFKGNDDSRTDAFESIHVEESEEGARLENVGPLSGKAAEYQRKCSKTAIHHDAVIHSNDANSHVNTKSNEDKQGAAEKTTKGDHQNHDASRQNGYPSSDQNQDQTYPPVDSAVNKIDVRQETKVQLDRLLTQKSRSLTPGEKTFLEDLSQRGDIREVTAAVSSLQKEHIFFDITSYPPYPPPDDVKTSPRESSGLGHAPCSSIMPSNPVSAETISKRRKFVESRQESCLQNDLWKAHMRGISTNGTLLSQSFRRRYHGSGRVPLPPPSPTKTLLPSGIQPVNKSSTRRSLSANVADAAPLGGGGQKTSLLTTHHENEPPPHANARSALTTAAGDDDPFLHITIRGSNRNRRGNLRSSSFGSLVSSVTDSIGGWSEYRVDGRRGVREREGCSSIVSREDSSIPTVHTLHTMASSLSTFDSARLRIRDASRSDDDDIDKGGCNNVFTREITPLPSPKESVRERLLSNLRKVPTWLALSGRDGSSQGKAFVSTFVTRMASSSSHYAGEGVEIAEDNGSQLIDAPETENHMARWHGGRDNLRKKGALFRESGYCGSCTESTLTNITAGTDGEEKTTISRQDTQNERDDGPNGTGRDSPSSGDGQDTHEDVQYEGEMSAQQNQLHVPLIVPVRIFTRSTSLDEADYGLDIGHGRFSEYSSFGATRSRASSVSDLRTSLSYDDLDIFDADVTATAAATAAMVPTGVDAVAETRDHGTIQDDGRRAAHVDEQANGFADVTEGSGSSLVFNCDDSTTNHKTRLCLASLYNSWRFVGNGGLSKKGINAENGYAAMPLLMEDNFRSVRKSSSSSGLLPQTMPFQILGTSANDVSSQPHVLSPPLMESLQAFLPSALAASSNFWLKYSMIRDGASLATLLTQVRASSHTILAVETIDGECFGSFSSTPWRNQGPRFYGSGEAFLWKMRKARTTPCHSVIDQAQLESEIDVFPWTGHNYYIQLCTAEKLAIGVDEDGGFGLLLESNLHYGVSNPCSTFANPSLAQNVPSGHNFEIANVEVWALTPFFTVEDAEKMELKKLFLEEQQVTLS